MTYRYLFILILSIFTTFSCNKNPDSTYVKATYLGIDYRKCSCCGGYFLAINNDSTYRALSINGLYKDSTLEIGKSYLIQYKNSNTICGSIEKLIEITDLK